MTSTTTGVLEQVSSLLSGVCVSDEVTGQFDTVPDLVGLLVAAGRVQRLMDAVIATAVGEVADRDRRSCEEQVSAPAGCRDVTELLRRTLRVDVGTARRYVTAGRGVRRDQSMSAGELLPARFEQLAQVLRDGELSVTGFLAATAPLQAVLSRIGAADLADADRVLAEAARGLDLPDAEGRPGPVPTTDELAALAHHIVLLLDPDGKEPEDERANRNRGLTLGRARDGLVPIRGGLLPDVAGQLQRLLDALLNPKAGDAGSAGAAAPGQAGEADADAAGAGGAGVGGAGGTAPGHGVADPAGAPGGGSAEDSGSTSGAAGHDGSGVRFTTEDDDAAGYGDSSDPFDPDELPEPVDPRSPAQKRHDAFASILTTAAGTGGFPTLGGAAPTLVVSVTAEDYASGSGRANIEGTGWEVPLGVAHQTACAGGIQRVMFDDHGQITSIGTSARIFNALQRRAITLRDRECVIPGCHIPATWCEIHHVIEHAQGGPTHTSNGVALCWHHHRTLDTSGWQIRMRGGVPEIRGPSWWDPYGGWHQPRIRHGTRRALADALGPPGR